MKNQMHPSYLLLVTIMIPAIICLYNLASYSESIYDNRRHIPAQCAFRMDIAGEPHQRHAVVTLLTTSSYVSQAVVLGKSLLVYSHLPCNIEKIAFVTPHSDLTREDHYRLSEVGWTIRKIPTISYPSRINSHTVKRERYIPLLTKLSLFNMTAYNAILYLDSDTIVLGDIHKLFTRDIPGMRERGMHLGWARDQGTEYRARTFNAGVMLVIPSTPLFYGLLKFLKVGKFDTGMVEQGLLNSFFGTTQYQIHQKFNTLSSIPMQNSTLYQDMKDDIRIFHSTYFKPTDSFYLVRCYWHGTQDLCREWQSLDRLNIKVYGRHDLSEVDPNDT